MKIEQILIEARKKIENGWVQGSYVSIASGSHCYCTFGAIAFSQVESKFLNSCHVAVLFRQVNEIDHIPSWNDDPSRTKEEVLEAFDKAILYARENGL